MTSGEAKTAARRPLLIPRTASRAWPRQQTCVELNHKGNLAAQVVTQGTQPKWVKDHLAACGTLPEEHLRPGAIVHP